MRRVFAIAVLAISTFAAFALAAPKEKKPAAAAAPADIAADINKPRADARKVAFDTDEGTWLSLDVAPDGKTIAFDLLGDLYSLPIAGGAATRLTSGPGYDTQPRFSPDGKTIAFTSDRSGIDNLWLVDADGRNPRALTTEKGSYVRGPAWTPDGQYVMGRKEDGTKAGIPPVELWLFHVDGGSGVALTTRDDASNTSGAVAAKNGRFIYYSARKANYSYTPDLSNGLWQIHRYDRRTAESLPITNGVGGGVRPALSPDGKTLVYVSRIDNQTVLVTRDLDSGREKVLSRELSRDEQEGFGQLDIWPGYAFTPDGNAIVSWSGGKLRRFDAQSGAATVIPFTVHVEQWLAPRVAWQDRIEGGAFRARILRTANASPDGSRIVFGALGQIWIQDVANGKAAGAPRRLTSSPPEAREYAPTFSPNGSSVAYVTWNDAEGGNLWRIPATGGTAKKLTTAPGHYANPTWSQKGDRISVIRGSGLEFRGRQPEEEDYFEAYWLNADGGELHLATTINSPGGLRFHPRAFWSADGERLYMAEALPPKKPGDIPKTDLVSVRLDGSDKRQHLRLPTVGELVPSPDAAWVAFTSRDNVYVTAFPEVATKEPAEVSIKDGAVPVFRLSQSAGAYVGWNGDSKSLTWIFGNEFHRAAVADILKWSADEKKKAAEKDKKETEKGKKDASDAAAPKKDDTILELAPSQAIAIDLQVPHSVPAGAFVVRNARVITMKGDEVLERADIVVSGNRISAIGAAGSLKVPQGAREFDAAGKTVIPGLIDTHAHLHYSGYEIFPDHKWEYDTNLAYGVTTTYDPSAPSHDTFSQAEMVDAGLLTGPRTYSSGDVLYGGQAFDIWADADTQADAIRQIRRMKAYGAQMVKVYQQPRRSARMYLAEACRKEKMLMTAEGGGELSTDMTMVLDGFTAFEHALPVHLYKDVVELVARSGTYYTPTLLVAYGGPWGELYYYQVRNPHDDAKLRRFVPHRQLDRLGRRHPFYPLEEYHFQDVGTGAADVVRAGGNVSLGAHGQLQGLGVHWELWALAGENADKGGPGMTPMQALRAATLAAADKIGFAPDLGSVEAGKLADFVILDKDPLADIHNSNSVSLVVKNGEVYEGETLKRLWPTEKPAPKYFWQNGQ